MKKKFTLNLISVIACSFACGVVVFIMIDSLLNQDYYWLLGGFFVLTVNVVACKLSINQIFSQLDEAILWK